MPTAVVDFKGNFTGLIAQSKAAGLLAGTAAGAGMRKTFKTRMVGLGKVAAIGLAGVGVASAAAVVGLYKIGESFDKARDKIRTGTGATGEALKGLENDFKMVVKSVPTSFGDASTAIADLHTRLGITGKPLQTLSTQFLELSRITKTDVGDNIRTVTRAFGDWEVSTGDQSKTLDFFFRASQASGASVSDLASKVVQFGAPLRQVGFSLEDSVALFAAFEKAGVNTQTMMPGLKLALGKFISEGRDPMEALRETFEGIKTGAISGEEALKIFGTRAGSDMVEAIRQGRFDLDDFTASLADGSETILQAGKDTQSFGEKWQLIKNKILVGLEPLAMKVFDGMGSAMDHLIPITDKVISGISGLANSLGKNLTPILAVLAGAFGVLLGTAAIGGLVSIMGTLIGVLVSGVALMLALAAGAVVAYQKFKPFRDVVDSVASALRDGLGAAMKWITGTAIPGITKAFSSFVSGLKGSGGPGSFFTDLGNAVAKLAGWVTGSLVPAFKTYLWPILKAVGGFIGAHLKPILIGLGLAIAAIHAPALLVVGVFIYLYQRFELFRKVVAFVVGVVITLVKTALAVITGVVKAIGWAIANILVPAFKGILGVAKTVWSAVSGAVSAAWSFIFPVLKAVAGFLGGVLAGAFKAFLGVAKTVWSAVSAAISAAWNFIKPILAAVIGFLGGVLAGAFKAFRTVAQTVWSAVSAAISAAWNFIKPILAAVIGFFTGPVASTFKAFRTVAQTVMAAVRTAILAAWNFIRPILQAVIGFFTGVLSGAFKAFLGVAKFVWSLVRAAIKDAWNFIKPILAAVVGFIRDHLVPRFQAFLGVAKTVWDAVRVAIRAAWDFIKPILKAVVDFVRDKLESRFRAFRDVAKTVWDAVRGSVQSAWDKVKPVFQAVVDFVRDKLKPVWNTISEAVKTAFDKIPGLIRGALSTAGGIVGRFMRGAATIADAIGLSNIAEALRRGATSAESWGKGGATAASHLTTAANKRASGGFVDGPVPVGAGFKTNGALAVVGEGRRQYPEYVIPSDPQYRARALALWESAGARLMQGGGLLDKVKSAGGALVDWGSDRVGDIVGMARAILAGVVEKTWPTLPLDGPMPGSFFPALPSGSVNKLRAKVIELIRGKAQEEQGKAEMAADSLTGGGFTPRGGGGRAGAYTPGMLAARREVLGVFGQMQVGGYANRNIAGTGQVSDHARYRAWDFMVPLRSSKGTRIADFLLQRAGAYGLKYLIWNAQRNSGSGWGPYRHPSGSNDNTLMHRDHVHASFFARGGQLPMTVHRQSFDGGGTLQRGWNAVRNDLGHPEDLTRERTGPAVEFTGDVNLNDGVDIELLSRKLAFHVSAAGL